MDFLESLEHKVQILCEQYANSKKQIAALQEHLSCLEAENKGLRDQLEKFEEKILLGNRTVEEMGQERELTRLFVDDLMEKVDSIITPSHE